MGELCRNKGCTKGLVTVYSWIIFVKGHVSITDILTNFPPQSAPEQLCSPMNHWHFRVPIICTFLIMTISLYFLTLSVKNFRYVWGANRHFYPQNELLIADN